MWKDKKGARYTHTLSLRALRNHTRTKTKPSLREVLFTPERERHKGFLSILQRVCVVCILYLILYRWKIKKDINKKNVDCWRLSFLKKDTWRVLTLVLQNTQYLERFSTVFCPVCVGILHYWVSGKIKIDTLAHTFIFTLWLPF